MRARHPTPRLAAAVPASAVTWRPGCDLNLAVLDIIAMQNETIALASKPGKLSLSLRNPVRRTGEAKSEVDHSIADDGPSSPLSALAILGGVQSSSAPVATSWKIGG
jgi:Flp pilus assembly protein CpaB